MNYPTFIIILTACLSITACGRYFISDTILPDSIIQVDPDHRLYDGRHVRFIAAKNELKENPASISGRKKYTYADLTGQSGIVDGEYSLTGGAYYIIRLENRELVKIPSRDFLLVTEFNDDVLLFNGP